METKTQTLEFAKNPNPPTKVKCTQCNRSFELEECIKEIPCPPPHTTVVEGVIVCPNCGLTRHSYWMPEHLRFDQARLKNAVMEWQTKRTTKTFGEYKRRLAIFQNNFDVSQRKYAAIFGEKDKNGEAKT
jgi:uncharacterized protein with PIN domain